VIPFISKTVRDRIKRNNYGQRSRVKGINGNIANYNANVPKHLQKELLVIEDFDILELFDEQEWTCMCHRVPNFTGCYKYVDPSKSGREDGAPTIGHINNTANGGGHTRANVGVMRYECNAAICYDIEKTRSSKVERLSRSHSGVKANGKPYTKKKKKRIQSKGWGSQTRKIQGRKNRW